jgi:hypothetical protein
LHARTADAAGAHADGTAQAATGEARGAYTVALAGVAVAGIGIAGTWLASEPALAGAADAIAWAQRENSAAARAMVSVALGALAALGVVAAWAYAVAGGRPVRVGNGRGSMALDELGAWVRDALEARPDVLEAQVRLRNRQRRGVGVTLRLWVAADARLAETTRAAEATMQAVLGAQAGVRIATPVAIELRYEELLMRARRGDA